MNLATAVASTAAIAAIGLAPLPAFSQSTTDTSASAGQSAGSGITWPHERGFWGHAGISFGRADLDASCPGGFACDTKDQTWRVYGGGRFNNAIGLEVGALNIGRFDRGGGRTDGWGIDIPLIAGFPIGANSAIFGKLGVLYARTEVEGAAPGLRTGKERGWGPRWGIGGQIGLSRDWALRADWDRYRVAFPGSKEDLDTFTIGAQYTFR